MGINQPDVYCEMGAKHTEGNTICKDTTYVNISLHACICNNNDQISLHTCICNNNDQILFFNAVTFSSVHREMLKSPYQLRVQESPSSNCKTFVLDLHIHQASRL